VKYGIDSWATEEVACRPSLEQPQRVDLAIVGRLHTGLCAAYQLKQVEPSLGLAVIAGDWEGARASGHNDGYVMTRLYREPGTSVAESRRYGRPLR
jgi:glycine/D-amino acid oxidase-like deaminating enzyme